MKQTAVEWLIQALDESNIVDLNWIDSDRYYAIIEQAKEMEKQQMKGMYIEGSFAMMRKFDGKELVTADEYISETYGNKGSETKQ